MPPANDPARGEGGGHPVVIDGAVEVVLHVLLTAPHDFDRAVDFLGNTRGLFDTVHLEPAPEPASDQLVMDDHLFKRETGDFRCYGLRARNDFLNIAGDIRVWRLKVFEKWL